ncbi:hypothetical protein E2562_011244 [Oryza meyeriana var. granulata]|uniref:tRNA-uridine aminocarboxypropyltransferase n=1 Tax=Oryza meyeriana var. granulata TaxID=110450 RepID=A0A6G1DGK2_9ORYZ|nr:hypothetical protein E2562_011244 [Oryza meyeriana var. granulata]
MDYYDPLPSAAGDDTADQTPPGRTVCLAGCGCPSSVCLCPYLPPSLLRTSTTVVILHHPHALRPPPQPPLHPTPPRPLPLQSSSHPRPAASSLPLPPFPLIPRSPPSPALLLFPWPDAADLASWCRSTPPAARPNPTLLLLDGTWKQAKKMHAAGLPFLSFAVPVSLPIDCGVDGDSMFESELVVRKEPHKGCMSTMEAVGRALQLLEQEGRGAEIEETMVGGCSGRWSPFRLSTCSTGRMKPREKMRKKKDIKRDEEMKRAARLE